MFSEDIKRSVGWNGLNYGKTITVFTDHEKDGHFLVQDLIHFCSTSINGSSQLEVFCRIGVTKIDKTRK